MLIKIGPTEEPTDIVDLLVECHGRIRSFIGLAQRLATAQEVTPEEVRDAAARVVRYFREALPLHVADEEQSILPRLSGKTPDLDAALADMRNEHAEHEPHLESLLDTCRVLQTSPERLNEFRQTLQAAASTLEKEFVTHLEKEEQVILPAIRELATPEERAAMLQELRARRTKG
jgi:iron-sulfur cluster repair protein YtfE (RIC family)